jgi:TolA-binding protein
MGSEPRVSLYRAKVELDDTGARMNLDLQKDSKKMYIVVTDPESHLKKEMSLYIKQATQVLMYCHNDLRRFVAEMVCVKHQRVTLRDINKVIENLTNQNLEMQANFLRMQEQHEQEMNSIEEKGIEIRDEEDEFKIPITKTQNDLQFPSVSNLKRLD